MTSRAPGATAADSEPAILEHRGSVVAGTQPDVKPGADTRRDAAAAAEEAVREAGERAGPDHLDAHRASLITGS